MNLDLQIFVMYSVQFLHPNFEENILKKINFSGHISCCKRGIGITIELNKKKLWAVAAVYRRYSTFPTDARSYALLKELSTKFPKFHSGT